MKAIVTLGLLLATSAQAQVFVNDAVLVGDGERVRMDVMIAADGSIEAATQMEAPDGVRVIEGGYVTDGLFVPYSHVGLVDISLEDATNDTRAEESATSVALRAADAFNPKSVAVGNSRVEGITHIATVGGRSGTLFAGTGAIVDTSGNFTSVVSEDAFIMANLGEAGKGVAGGSRSAAMAQLRDALADAQAVGVKSDADFGDVLTRRDARQLRLALRGEIPLMVRANRAVDLLRIAELKEDFADLDIIVVGAKEAWQVADQMAAAGIKVMIDPHDNLPDSFESVGARADNVQILEAAGVDYAFTTASADLSHNVRVIGQHAGNAVGEGLPWNKAWAAVTTTPRSWFGIEDAGVVVWSGDPLEVTSRAVMMFVDGQEVPLRSRQTALRDRYNPARTDTRPHKYR